MIETKTVWIILAISLLLLLATKIVFSIIEKHLKKGINITQDTFEGISYRKRIRTIRFASVLFLIIFIVGSLLLFILHKRPQNALLPISTIFVPMIYAAFRYWQSYRWDKSTMGNISARNKDSFITNNSRFALYLRGFKDDNYASEVDLANSQPSNRFSEYHFISLLKTTIPVCAVGMTKEVDSPYGADRIYLEDETWKEDVIDLMKKSNEIYILINDRESCIWEIEQSLSFKEKTTYLVDDYERYEHAREILKDKVEFPELSEELDGDKICCILLKEDHHRVTYYKNTLEGYQNILHIDLPKKSNLKKGYSNIWWICVSIFLVFVIIMAVLQHIKDTNINLSYGEEVKLADVNVDCIDSLDFVVVCFNNDNPITYASQHLDPSEQIDFISFVDNNKNSISTSNIIYLLYDGFPKSYCALRKIICDNFDNRVRTVDYLHLISWLKYKDFEGDICKLTYQKHSCISLCEEDVCEILNTRYIGSDIQKAIEKEKFLNDSIYYKTDLYKVAIDACKQFNTMILEKKAPKPYLLLDVLPFGVNIINNGNEIVIIEANTTKPASKTHEFEITVPDKIWVKFLPVDLKDEPVLINVPIKNTKAGYYIFQIDVDADERIVLTIIEKSTSQLIFKKSIDEFITKESSIKR